MHTSYLTQEQKAFYHEHGFLVVKNLLTPPEVEKYIRLYDDFLSGKIATGNSRADLGAYLGERKATENITQIMWPSAFVPALLPMVYHQRALSISKELIGEDAAMDFDMLINKAPGTNTLTPWHQDEAYWPDLPDKRATSCWLALDQATLANGCMWFVPGSHKAPVRPHRFATQKGGALMCDATEEEATAIPLALGSCTFHDGRTLHYSRGNTTHHQRRAFIINFRPASMITLERSQGFDHGRNNASDRQLKNDHFR